MTDLWYEASADQDAITREAALAQAEASMLPVWPFLFEAASGRELEHRLAFAGRRLEHIAAQCGMDPGELHDMARRRFALLQEARMRRQALPEGQDPLGWVPDGSGFGSGPQKPDQHDEGPDFSGDYAEVPQGAPLGPDPQITAPRFETPGAVSEATAARLPKSQCKCGCKLTGKGKCRGCKDAPGNCSCGPDAACGGMEGAQKTAGLLRSAAPQVPGSGTGAGAYSTAPAGLSQGTSSPDGVTPGGLLTSTSRAPVSAPPSGTQASGTAAGYDLTPAQDVTASRRTAQRDPVYDQVKSVAASVAASNPHLPPSECRRIARRVVGGYLLKQADLTNSVLHDAPWEGNGQGGGGGTHFIPRPGEAGAGAGEAAGLEEAAELAAL